MLFPVRVNRGYPVFGKVHSSVPGLLTWFQVIIPVNRVFVEAVLCYLFPNPLIGYFFALSQPVYNLYALPIVGGKPPLRFSTY